MDCKYPSSAHLSFRAHVCSFATIRDPTCVSRYTVTTGRGSTPTATDLGRGFPDVSGFAGNIGIVADGAAAGSGGTSASTPFMAGVVGVLNSQLIAAGKGYVGFLNPTLYAANRDTNGSAFNDIVM